MKRALARTGAGLPASRQTGSAGASARRRGWVWGREKKGSTCCERAQEGYWMRQMAPPMRMITDGWNVSAKPSERACAPFA
eukprot:2034050-Pleurochrysis_carterae.AAC.5